MHSHSLSQPILPRPALSNLRKIVGEGFFASTKDFTDVAINKRDEKVNYLLHHEMLSPY
jgi:hypothetical protein